MNKSGLNRDELELILSVLRRYPEISSVILFGSRAKGNCRHNSDIDLAVEGIDSHLQIEKLAMDLEDLPLPYRFDVQSLSRIENPQLLDHIHRVGIILYSKSIND